MKKIITLLFLTLMLMSKSQDILPCKQHSLIVLAQTIDSLIHQPTLIKLCSDDQLEIGAFGADSYFWNGGIIPVSYNLFGQNWSMTFCNIPGYQNSFNLISGITQVVIIGYEIENDIECIMVYDFYIMNDCIPTEILINKLDKNVEYTKYYDIDSKEVFNLENNTLYIKEIKLGRNIYRTKFIINS